MVSTILDTRARWIVAARLRRVIRRALQRRLSPHFLDRRAEVVERKLPLVCAQLLRLLAEQRLPELRNQMLKATDLLRALRVRSLKPRQAETTSKTPSPSRKPWSSTEILASPRGTKSLLR